MLNTGNDRSGDEKKKASVERKKALISMGFQHTPKKYDNANDFRQK